MAGRPLQNHPRAFDDSKLATMNEPLRVRVERLKNNTRSPIPLPDTEDGQQPAYSKEEIGRFEQWLVTEWAGGGLYEVTVTDSSEPTPQVMKWQPFWRIEEFPERTPPTLQAASRNGPQPQIAQPPVPQARPIMSTPAFPNGFPPGQAPYAQPYQQPYVQPYYQAPQMPPPPVIGSPQWTAWEQERDRRERDLEVKKLREETTQREREAISARHAAELAGVRRESEERFTRLETMMANLASTLKEPAKPANDPAIETLKLQLAQTQAMAADAARRADEERRERETERRETATRELIKSQADAAARQFDLLQKQIEQQARDAQAAAQAALIASQQNRPDPLTPIFALMQEQARVNADAIKEIARANKDSLDGLKGYMMNPRDIMEMSQRGQAGADAATERTANMFNRVLDTQTKVMENALQMQPGGSGVVDVIREGLDHAKQFAERYVGAKATTAKMEAHAQVQIAQAQAHVLATQAQAANPAAFPPPPHMQPQQIRAPQPVHAEPHLAGPVIVPQAPAQPAQPPQPERLWGRTDPEWFGPLTPEVLELRSGVEVFLDSLRQEPPRLDKDGAIIGVSPTQAGQGIMVAAGIAHERGVIVPAMAELLAVGKFNEFLGVLLPDAPPPYREDVVKLLTAEFNKAAAGGDDDGEGEDGEDEEEGEEEEGEEEEAPPLAAVVRPPANGRRARAQAQ